MQAKIDEQQRLLELLKTPSPQRRRATPARTSSTESRCLDLGQGSMIILYTVVTAG